MYVYVVFRALARVSAELYAKEEVMKFTKLILALLLIAAMAFTMVACPGSSETACDKCGKDPCVCPPDNTCDVCGKDPCVCPSEDVCDVCGKDPCVCPPNEGGEEGGQEQPPAPGNLVAEAIPETDTAKITGHTGKYTGKLEIPAQVTIGGTVYTVVEIAPDAFADNPAVTEIVVPDTVLSIGKGAFRGADAVTSLTLPFVGGSAESNTYIGYIFGASSFAENALYTPAGLATVTLSDACTAIADFAFDYCASLKNVTIGKNVTYIGACAFNACALESLVVPDSVAFVGKGAVAKCPIASLTLPFVGEDASGKVGYLGHLFGASSYAENSRFVPADFADITITSVCTTIGEGAFYDCAKLVDPKLPATITAIGADAFTNTAFYEAQPAGQVYVGNVLYSYKGEMTDTAVVVKDGTIAIAANAFRDRGVTAVTIPESVIAIGKGAFAGSALTSIELSFVGEHAAATDTGYFGYIFGAETPAESAAAVPASLKTVTLRSSCSILAPRAFYACENLETVEIGSGVDSIAKDAFGACSKLTTIRVNSANATFKNDSGLVYNKAGNELFAVPGAISGRVQLLNVTEIADDMFRGCSAITEIVLPATLLSIGDGAFADTENLATLNFPASLAKVGEGALDGNKWFADQADGLVYTSHVLYCFKGEVGEGVSGEVTVKDGTLGIAAGAFAGKQITSVVLPASVTNIGENAFANCPIEDLTVPFIGSGDPATPYIGYLFGAPSAAQSASYIPATLTKVTVLDGCTALGDGAFAGCRGVSEIVLPSSIVSAAVDCLKDTAWVKNHPAGVIYAGRVAYGYSAPKMSYAEMMDKIAAGEDIENTYDVILRADTVRINENAFSDSGIRSIRIPDTVKSIGNRAFYSCVALKSVRMSSYLEEIGTYAFYSCSTLQEIYIPGTVKVISDNAFNSCRGMGTLILGNGIERVGEKAFNSCESLNTIRCDFAAAQWRALSAASHESNLETLFSKRPKYAVEPSEYYVNPPFEVEENA